MIASRANYFISPLLLSIAGLFLLAPQWISGHISHDSPKTEQQNTTNGLAQNTNESIDVLANDPIRYTRLKYDVYYLQTLKRWQKKHNYEEIGSDKITTNEGKIIDSPVTYYTNPRVDINNITEDDLIVEALSRTYLSRMTHNNMHDYDRLEDRRRSSDPKLVSKERCFDELNYLNDRLKEIQFARRGDKSVRTRLHPELATFFDSYGATEPGLLLGNYFWLGNWEQCYRRQIFDITHNASSSNMNTNDANGAKTKLISFTGRSCIVSIRKPEWDEKIALRTRELQARHYFKYKNQDLDFKRFFRIQVGVCLPESCDSNIIIDHLMTNETLKLKFRELVMHRIQEPYNGYNMTNVYCLPDETSPLRQLDLSGWLFVLVNCLWFMSMLVATLVEHYDLVGLKAFKEAAKKSQERSLAQKLVVSLSLQENYRTWSIIGGSEKREKKTPSAGSVTNGTTNLATSADLIFLHAIKVCLLPLVMTGHIALIIYMLCKRPLDYDAMSQLGIHLLGGTSFFVDWYYCISSFIITYTMFCANKVETNTLRQWVYSIFHRYWRLMPTYLYAFWFSRSIFHLTGWGGVWDYGTSTMGNRAVCQRESWLTPITMTPNFYPLYEECIMPAWYIGADMQYYLITPFLLLALHKSAKLGYALCLSIIGSSVLLRAWRYATNDHLLLVDLLRPRSDLTLRNNWDIYETYTMPQYRISSYIIGLMAGHYTYMVRSGKWSSPLYSGFKQQSTDLEPSKRRAQKNRLIVGLPAMYFGVAFMFLTWFTDRTFPRSLERYARLFVVLGYSTSNMMATWPPALLMVTIILGLWPKAKAWMEHRNWIYLSRVNYFVFLFQVDIMFWIEQNSSKVIESYVTDQVLLFFTVITVLYIISFFTTILVSNPLARLETELVGVHMRGKRPRKPVATSEEATNLVSLPTESKKQEEGPLAGGSNGTEPASSVDGPEKGGSKRC